MPSCGCACVGNAPSVIVPFSRVWGEAHSEGFCSLIWGCSLGGCYRCGLSDAQELNVTFVAKSLFVLHVKSILTASETLCMSYYFQIVSRLILQLKIGQLFNRPHIPIDYQYGVSELRISVCSLPWHRVDSVWLSFKYCSTVCA